MVAGAPSRQREPKEDVRTAVPLRLIQINKMRQPDPGTRACAG